MRYIHTTVTRKKSVNVTFCKTLDWKIFSALCTVAVVVVVVVVIGVVVVVPISEITSALCELVKAGIRK
jgi:hypothetical protein